jgi:small-conductance mechanosensitive channel
MPSLVPDLGWITDALAIAGAALAALAVHWAIMKLLERAARRTRWGGDELILARLRGPTQWFTVAIAVASTARALVTSPDSIAIWRQALGLIFPALLGWLSVAGLHAVEDLVVLRADVSVEDNLRARRRRTRAAILRRIGVFLIVFLTLCLMLLSIPSIRSIGVTLMASAGIAGLVVGAAAQPALKNLIAGVQMAFTEPIRIDDVVIIEGEWGRIEEIRLTYVVVKLWDDRRLVVPVSKFLEAPFQNWTRERSELTGAVSWFLDPTADVAQLREAAERAIRASGRWDGRTAGVQLIEMRADAIEVRALMTARDAGAVWDLRCEVREAVLQWLRAEMPEALPRRRLEMADFSPPPPGGGD